MKDLFNQISNGLGGLGGLGDKLNGALGGQQKADAPSGQGTGNALGDMVKSAGGLGGLLGSAALGGLVSLSGDLTVNSGDALTLLCAIFYAAHIVAVAKVSPGKDIYLLTVFQFAFAALYAWIGGMLTETFPVHALADPNVILPLCYLGVMATTVALLFQNVGQVNSDPASASVILSLESVFGVLCSVLFADDTVSLRMAAGFVLIFVAVMCSETKFAFLRGKAAVSEKKTI